MGHAKHGTHIKTVGKLLRHELEPADLPGRSSLETNRNAPRYRNAVLAACDWVEAENERRKQHGAVRVLWKDGRPVEQPPVESAPMGVRREVPGHPSHRAGENEMVGNQGSEGGHGK